jgi:chromosome segregation ATPase
VKLTSTALLRAADDASTNLLQYGFGGAVLAIFVVPVFYIMARSAQNREAARLAIEQKEHQARLDRETRENELRAESQRKLIDALVASVDSQKLALEQWRRFEEQEERTHAALLAGMAQVTATLAQISERLASQQQHSATTATAQTQLAQLLGDVATQIQTLKRPA